MAYRRMGTRPGWTAISARWQTGDSLKPNLRNLTYGSGFHPLPVGHILPLDP